MKRWIIAAFSIFSVGCAIGSHDIILRGAISPNIPYVSQKCSNWCWAASIEMLSSWNNNKVSQCELINPKCCNSPCSSECNVGMNEQDVIERLRKYFFVSFIEGQISQRDMIRALDANKIIAVLFIDDTLALGHMTLVTGYDTTGDVPIFRFQDPNPSIGNPYYISYNDLSNKPYGKGGWKFSLIIQKKDEFK